MDIDGGANIFVIKNKPLFFTLNLQAQSYTQASGSQALSQGVCIALFRFNGTNKIYPCPAYYVPDNPVSTCSLGALKYYIGFTSAACESLLHCSFVDPQGKSYLFPTTVQNNLDYLDFEFLQPSDVQFRKNLEPVIAGLATKYPSSQLIHQRFGHINNDKIRKMCTEQHLTDLPKTYKPLCTPCSICLATKGKRIP
jgi:hypothetical protein